MEYVNCDLCGADDTKFLFYDNSFKLVRCRRCRLVYVNPRPKEYVAYPHFSYYKNYIAHEDGFVAEAKDFLKRIKEYTENGRILDIGCAAGFFLNEARKSGWEAYGVETSETLAGYAKEKFSLNVFTGHLEKANFSERYFDAVTMFDLLSHLRSPVRTLKEIRRVLKNGGLLVIKGGNKGRLRTKKAGGASWGSPDHLYHFSEKTIQELLKKSGFEIIKMYSEAMMGSLFNHKDLIVSGETGVCDFIHRHKSFFSKPYRLFRRAVRSSLGRVLGYLPVDSIVMVYALKS